MLGEWSLILLTSNHRWNKFSANPMYKFRMLEAFLPNPESKNCLAGKLSAGGGGGGVTHGFHSRTDGVTILPNSQEMRIAP
jgi:hypothetical protein